MYEVVLSTADIEPSTTNIETPAFMTSTILRISDQKPLAEYNVSLKLVDPCQNSTVATRHVVTEMRPPGKYCRYWRICMCSLYHSWP